jgi:sulfonate transport system ATP-binding protein
MNISVLDRTPRPEEMLSGTGAPVRLRGLRKVYGKHSVLCGIDLDIPAGQFVAIVGGSGCGKSSLLRLLAGLEQPTGGKTEIDGATEAWRNQVRLMFQEPRLLPWRRVAANVEIGLSRSRRAGDRRRKALETLTQVGLSGRDRDWPTVLSGGQEQRVALARALVSHTRILAFDEPLGALDALTRIEMQSLIEQVWRDKGFTAVVVTHDVAEAVTLADRILLLDHGRIEMDVLVDLPRPRRHGDPKAALIEGRILNRLLTVS